MGDSDDPDCSTGDLESQSSSVYRCNDGIDNDLDGLIDSVDPSCTSGLETEEMPVKMASIMTLTDGPILMICRDSPH